MLLSKQGDSMTTSLSQSFKSEGARMNNPAFKKDQPKESSMKTNNKGPQMNYFDQLRYDRLVAKYGKSVLNKTELSHELGVSVSTLNNCISRGVGVEYLKINTSGKNSILVYPLENVVSYLSNTIKVA